MAEDEDLEQDSEAYRKWRSGNDNDKVTDDEDKREIAIPKEEASEESKDNEKE